MNMIFGGINALSVLSTLLYANINTEDVARVYILNGWKQVRRLDLNVKKVSSIHWNGHFDIEFRRPEKMQDEWRIVSGPIVVRPGEVTTYSTDINVAGDFASITTDSALPLEGGFGDGIGAVKPISEAISKFETKAITSVRHIYIVQKLHIIRSGNTKIVMYTNESTSLVFTKEP